VPDVYLEMVHELVLGVEDMQQMTASFLVNCINHLIKNAVHVLHEH